MHPVGAIEEASRPPPEGCRGLDGGRSERVERWRDQRDAASTCVGSDGDELVVGAIRQQARGTRECAADCGLAAAAIAELSHEIATGSQGVPASEWHERAGRRVTGTGDGAGLVIAAPAVGALATGVAAIKLGTPRPAGAVRGPVAHRTPPGLDDVVWEVGHRCWGLALAHGSILNEGCHARHRLYGTAPRGGDSPRAHRPGATTLSPLESSQRNPWPLATTSTSRIVSLRCHNSCRPRNVVDRPGAGETIRNVWRSAHPTTETIRNVWPSARPTAETTRDVAIVDQWLETIRDVCSEAHAHTCHTTRAEQRMRIASFDAAPPLTPWPR